MKNKTEIRYVVHESGGFIKEGDIHFTSLSTAKKYMKTHHKFMIECGATLFTLSKDESIDGFYNDLHTTGINTRTTIINL